MDILAFFRMGEGMNLALKWFVVDTGCEDGIAGLPRAGAI